MEIQADNLRSTLRSNSRRPEDIANAVKDYPKSNYVSYLLVCSLIFVAS